MTSRTNPPMPDRINLHQLRAEAEANHVDGATFAFGVRVQADDLLALIDTAEAAQTLLRQLDELVAGKHTPPDTRQRAEWAIGATLHLRDPLAKFDPPDRPDPHKQDG